jgi:hypothetical protein
MFKIGKNLLMPVKSRAVAPVRRSNLQNSMSFKKKIALLTQKQDRLSSR